MNEFQENNEVVNLIDVFEAIEILISDAAAAIDSGNYSDALEGFRLALELMHRFFGDNTELSELEKNIAGIYDLLLEDHQDPN